MDSEGQAGISPTDEKFLAAFEAGQIANQDFHHCDHLRLGWIQVRRLGLERASDAVAEAIRQFAARHGHADRYHETMTRFWVREVGMGIKRHSRGATPRAPLAWATGPSQAGEGI
jgi:hypothetical protein